MWFGNNWNKGISNGTKKVIKVRHKSLTSVAVVLFFLSIPRLASAHVAVGPAQVGVAAEQIFTMSVPNERNAAVT
jgi:uncharacterized protein YcnI